MAIFPLSRALRTHPYDGRKERSCQEAGGSGFPVLCLFSDDSAPEYGRGVGSCASAERRIGSKRNLQARQGKAGRRRNEVPAEENKALARRVMEELFNEGNLDAAEELIAPDFVDHDPAMPEDVRGPEGFKEYVRAFRSAFPDLHVRIEDQVAEGDKVVQRWTGTGTHDGVLVYDVARGYPRIS